MGWFEKGNLTFRKLIVRKKQFGIQNKKSSTDGLVYLTKKILENMENSFDTLKPPPFPSTLFTPKELKSLHRKSLCINIAHAFGLANYAHSTIREILDLFSYCTPGRFAPPIYACNSIMLVSHTLTNTIKHKWQF